MYYGFKIDEKHSYNDFGLRIMDRELNPPNKTKIKEPIPFMNGTYDFSNLNGEQVYEERIIKYTLDLKCKNKLEFISKKMLITQWLMEGDKRPLYDDLIPGYYFLAECENGPVFAENPNGSEITVTFVANPFKIGIDLEGSDIWDTFNFLIDAYQPTGYDIIGTKTLNIINVGRIVSPTINVTSIMSITFNSKTYNLLVGDNKFYDFKLLNGDNNIVVNGTGKISFIFRKVSL